MKKDTFKLINEDGKEVEYETIFILESEENPHNYICYTDNTYDEDGKLKTYLSIYEETEDSANIYPIDSVEEWNNVSKQIEGLK